MNTLLPAFRFPVFACAWLLPAFWRYDAGSRESEPVTQTTD